MMKSVESAGNFYRNAYVTRQSDTQNRINDCGALNPESQEN